MVTRRRSAISGCSSSSVPWRRNASAGRSSRSPRRSAGRSRAGRRRSRSGPPSRGRSRAPRAAGRRRRARLGGVISSRSPARPTAGRRSPGSGSVRELAREHDVAVEDAARGVGDRLVQVVALDQHGVEAVIEPRVPRCRRARAAAAAWRTRSADSPWWPAARRSASPISRCAIAKRVTESISSSTSLALVAEVLGDRSSPCTAPFTRTSAGSSEGATTTTRARQPLGAEVVLDELAHLAAALADQADHDHVGLGVAGHHAEQRALADAGAGEQADALAAAARSGAR